MSTRPCRRISPPNGRFRSLHLDRGVSWTAAPSREMSAMKPKKDNKELLERAGSLHQAGRTSEAESLYRQVISRNAQNHLALSAYGALLFETGRIDDAIRHLQRAIAVQLSPAYLMT